MTDEKGDRPGKRPSYRFSTHPSKAGQVDWHEWGDEPFDLAREQDKPVLLSISAVWCHWCHVMDETDFSDDEIIDFVNHNFIPVRVDSDRRPDINSRYNQGGWPTVCFLTSEGEIIAGATFVPPDQFRRLLLDVLTVYRESPERIAQAVETVRERRADEAEMKPSQLDLSVVEGLMRVIEGAYDNENGGFGTEPKFPYTSVLNFLLARLAGEAEGNEGAMVRETLDAMSSGGIYDQVEGGFFRYSTTQDWSIPHFEKMLEDNAALMAVYAGAFMLSGNEPYGRVVQDIHRYMHDVLLDSQTGTFAGSQDADEDYYKLDGEARSKVDAPFVDRTVYAGWNAEAASALLKAYQALGEGDYRDEATAVLNYIWGTMWDGQKGLARYNDGENHAWGMLADTARTAAACLDAYESGCGDEWLDRSTKVARWMLSRLEDTEAGGFFDCAQAPGSKGYPSERNKLPVDNSIAAKILIRLGQNTGQKEFEEAAERTLKLLSGGFEQYGMFGADFVLAAMMSLDPAVRITIVGPPADAGTAELIRAAHNARIPFRSVEVLDPGEHGDDLDAVGYGYEGMPRAYLCVGDSCQPPVDDPAQLAQRLESSWTAIKGQDQP